MYNRILLFNDVKKHYSFVIMSAMAAEITGAWIFFTQGKKTSKLRANGLCEGNPPVTGGFPSQRASNAEHDVDVPCVKET